LISKSSTATMPSGMPVQLFKKKHISRKKDFIYGELID